MRHYDGEGDPAVEDLFLDGLHFVHVAGVSVPVGKVHNVHLGPEI